MNAGDFGLRQILKQLAPMALAIGIWFAPIPEGLTREAWHLFAITLGGVIRQRASHVCGVQG